MRWPSAVMIIVLISNTIVNGLTPTEDSVDLGADSPPIKLQSQDMEPFRSAFIKIALSVIPSVVSVIPTRTDTGNIFDNPLPEFFPGQFFRKQQERRVQGLGSGFIVSKKGYILTNYHVVVGAEEIEVILTNGNIYLTEVVGMDSLSDIAVLKMKGKLPELIPVYFGNSDSLQPGAWIAAIGNPFALTSTVTSGIVSALGRQVADPLTYQNFIQIDAAINPGNSGGPLVNLEGAVMGINTLIFSQTGGFMGVGFAIPINLARKVLQDIIYEGRVIRGYVGVSIQEITPELQEALGLKTNKGALVADVVKNQPASQAGIRSGDIIISLSDNEIEDANELRNIIAGIRPGKKVTVSLLRNSKSVQATITPIERTYEAIQKQQSIQRRTRPQRGVVKNKLGIGFVDITAQLRNRFKIPTTVDGVLVTRISPEIVDQRATLVPGNVISRVKASSTDWSDIKSVSDFKKFIKNVKNGEAVVLQVLQGDQTAFIAFRIDY